MADAPQPITYQDANPDLLVTVHVEVVTPPKDPS